MYAFAVKVILQEFPQNSKNQWPAQTRPQTPAWFSGSHFGLALPPAAETMPAHPHEGLLWAIVSNL